MRLSDDQKRTPRYLGGRDSFCSFLNEVSVNGNVYTYEVFFSNARPEFDQAPVGSLWFAASSHQDYLEAVAERAKSCSRCNFQNVVGGWEVFYRGGQEWIRVDRKGLVSLECARTRHPQHKSLFLDMRRLTWRTSQSLSSSQSKKKRRKEKAAQPSTKAAEARSLRDSADHGHLQSAEMDITFQPDSIEILQHGPLRENLWLGDLMKEFQSEPISCVKPNQDRGLKILQLLLDYPRPLSPTPHAESSLFIGFGDAIAEKPITLEDVMQELKFSEDFQGINHFTEEEDETPSGPKVAEFLEEMLKRSRRDGDGLFSVLNLPTPNIAHDCRPSHPGSLNLKRHTIYHLSLQEGQDTSWSASIVPLSAITSCHLDQWTMSIFQFHVAGKKLWLAWPPTKGNLRVYTNWMKTHGGNLPVDVAIASLEGLEVLLVDKKQVAWTLPPATLHAVITFSPVAAHIGSYHTSAFDFETAQLAVSVLFEAFEGEILLVSQAVMTDVIRMLNELRTADLACWKALGDKMDGHASGLGSEISGWADFTKEKAACLCEELEIASDLIEG